MGKWTWVRSRGPLPHCIRSADPAHESKDHVSFLLLLLPGDMGHHQKTNSPFRLREASPFQGVLWEVHIQDILTSRLTETAS